MHRKSAVLMTLNWHSACNAETATGLLPHAKLMTRAESSFLQAALMQQ